MAKYLPVTGKILSFDRYWEDRFNPETQETEQVCVDSMRVEYTVNGRVYTHNFIGTDAHGNVGGEYEVLYREDNPEIVKSAGGIRRRRLGCLIPLIIVFLVVMVFCSMVHVSIG